MNIYVYIIEFVLAVAIVYAYYKLIETKKIKRYTQKNMPTDLKLFIYTQKVNVKKIVHQGK